jgi:hypothetical protein
MPIKTKAVTLYLIGLDHTEAAKRPAFSSLHEARSYVADMHNSDDLHIWSVTTTLDLAKIELTEMAANHHSR